MPASQAKNNGVREVVERHLRAALHELGLDSNLHADVNPVHFIRTEKLMVDSATHFVCDIRRLMKK